MKQISIMDGNVLRCPSCNSGNLHQESMSVFFGSIKKKINEISIEDEYKKNNPSKYSDGLLIQFWCECCSGDPELSIYHHKGSTYVEWESMRQKIQD
jgi:hypothetical protein